MFFYIDNLDLWFALYFTYIWFSDLLCFRKNTVIQKIYRYLQIFTDIYLYKWGGCLFWLMFWNNAFETNAASERKGYGSKDSNREGEDSLQHRERYDWTRLWGRGMGCHCLVTSYQIFFLPIPFNARTQPNKGDS